MMKWFFDWPYFLTAKTSGGGSPKFAGEIGEGRRKKG